MENTHEVQYLIQTSEGEFASNINEGTYIYYTKNISVAKVFDIYDTAKKMADEINDRLRSMEASFRVRVIRREIYIDFDETIDQFPPIDK